MVLKKTAIAIIAIMLSLSLNANEDLEQNTQYSDQCEKQYSLCLEKCDQENAEDSEKCYDTCDLKLADCEEKTKSE